MNHDEQMDYLRGLSGHGPTTSVYGQYAQSLKAIEETNSRMRQCTYEPVSSPSYPELRNIETYNVPAVQADQFQRREEDEPSFSEALFDFIDEFGVSVFGDWNEAVLLGCIVLCVLGLFIAGLVKGSFLAALVLGACGIIAGGFLYGAIVLGIAITLCGICVGLAGGAIWLVVKVLALIF